MTENQLLAFYHNELYETTEDFVDSFIEVFNFDALFFIFIFLVSSVWLIVFFEAGGGGGLLRNVCRPPLCDDACLQCFLTIENCSRLEMIFSYVFKIYQLLR